MANSASIGKDVIESLTLSMYEDARFIFREYIQNAADQIDKAIKECLITKGEIYITIDEEARSITIEDNATGVPKDSVEPVLKNIAQSTKRRGIDKGFRGIGRLGGLAYCEKLVFETSFNGEDTKSLMTWDAAKLKTILNDRESKEDASSVIDNVVSIRREVESNDEHYFKVHLIGITHPELLKVANVRRYLSMVAPVPFDASFHFQSKIYDQLAKDNLNLDEYTIFVNSEQLYKGYSSYIYDSEPSSKVVGEIIDVIFFKEVDEKDSIVYWGWYTIAERNQSLNQANFSRGLRLRKANIQVGDEHTLTKFHKDKRFQFYFFGEIHAISSYLIPNARRDFFSENTECLDFEKRIKSFFQTSLHKLCYTASDINSSRKKIDDFAQIQREYADKEEQGFSHVNERDELIQKMEQKKEAALSAHAKLRKISDSALTHNTIPIVTILEKVAQNKLTEVPTTVLPKPVNTPKLRTDTLTGLNKQQKELLNEVFAVIQNVLQVDMASNLIRKIEERFS